METVSTEHSCPLHFKFSSTDELQHSLRETYIFGEIIGRGSSADVHLLTHKETGQLYACKVVTEEKRMNDQQTMKTEISILQRINHPNIVSMHALYECPTGMWMILEYIDGSDALHALASLTEQQYNEETIAHYFRQVLEAVKYLHEHHIVHRDIKLDNILFTKQATGEIVLKLTDFGLSAEVTVEALTAKQQQRKQAPANTPNNASTSPKHSFLQQVFVSSNLSSHQRINSYDHLDLSYQNKSLSVLTEVRKKKK